MASKLPDRLNMRLRSNSSVLPPIFESDADRCCCGLRIYRGSNDDSEFRLPCTTLVRRGELIESRVEDGAAEVNVADLPLSTSSPSCTRSLLQAAFLLPTLSNML